MDRNRVWADINLDHIRENLSNMYKNLAEGTKICAVIKADAYGHGAVPITRMLEDVPYIWGYAAATFDEAMELRENGLKKPILVLGYTFPEHYRDMVRYEIRPAIFGYQMAEEFSKAAAAEGKDAPVHIAVDTGMSRIGFQVEKDAVDAVQRIFQLPGLVPEGIFTHFARSDERDKTSAREQLDLFRQMIRALSDAGVTFAIHHAANSAAILELPESCMDMVRAGITMYGLWPSDEIDRSFPLRRALSLKSRVVYVKTLPAGRAVSYGGTFVTEEDTVVATIPVGYADGIPRSLSNCGYVLIHGHKAPVIGRICMDQMMVDVTGIEDVRTGDVVTLIGTDGDREITLDELGDLSGRFNYEFVCGLGNRIPRVYYSGGQKVAEKDYYR